VPAGPATVYLPVGAVKADPGVRIWLSGAAPPPGLPAPAVITRAGWHRVERPPGPATARITITRP